MCVCVSVCVAFVCVWRLCVCVCGVCVWRLCIVCRMQQAQNPLAVNQPQAG